MENEEEINEIFKPKNVVSMRFQSYNNGVMQTEAYEYFDENNPVKRYPIFLDSVCLEQFREDSKAKRDIKGILIDWKEIEVERPFNRYCLKKGKKMYLISLSKTKH